MNSALLAGVYGQKCIIPVNSEQEEHKTCLEKVSQKPINYEEVSK